jgi:hypothetical protein
LVGGTSNNSSAWAIEGATPPPPPTPVAVPRGASPTEALREALVGRGLDRVALVLEPGCTYDGGIIVDRESRPFGAPAPDVSVLVGDGGLKSSNVTATVRLETKSPYARVLEVRGDGVVLRAENLRILHSSKSVASNYAVLASAGAELELRDCEISSSTGAGVAADGAARCVLVGCGLVSCARQGLAAFGGSKDTTTDGPAVVRLDRCRVERNGGDGVLVRDGAAVFLEGECVVDGNQGAGLRWFVVEEREAEAALVVADMDEDLIAPGVRFGRNNSKGAVVVDTGGGAGDDRAAAALAAALGRKMANDAGLVAVI